MMILQDDRNEFEKKHCHLIYGGRDRGLSGWGLATNGNSYAYWACSSEHLEALQRWVDSRSDIDPMQMPTEFADGDHVHIYTVRWSHPCLNGED